MSQLFKPSSEIIQAKNSLEARQKLQDFLKLVDNNPEIKTQAESAGIDTELLRRSVEVSAMATSQANNTINQAPNPFAGNAAHNNKAQPGNLFFNTQQNQNNSNDPTNTNNNSSK